MHYDCSSVRSWNPVNVFTHLALEALGCFLKVVQLLLEVFVRFGHEQQNVGLDVSSEDFGGRLSDVGWKKKKRNILLKGALPCPSLNPNYLRVLSFYVLI